MFVTAMKQNMATFESVHKNAEKQIVKNFIYCKLHKKFIPAFTLCLF